MSGRRRRQAAWRAAGYKLTPNGWRTGAYVDWEALGHDVFPKPRRPRRPHIQNDMYVLRNRQPVSVAELYPDLSDDEQTLAWGRDQEYHENRQVATTYVAGLRVSTIFIGLDHNFGRFFSSAAFDQDPGGLRRPVVFETMIFLDLPPETPNIWEWGFGKSPELKEVHDWAEEQARARLHPDLRELEDYQDRYCTWEEAEADHWRLVEYIELVSGVTRETKLLTPAQDTVSI